MKRCLLLTVACVLAAASPASAGWRIDRAKAIAEIVWHDPCDGAVTLRWSALPQGRWGQATPATCTVELRSDMPTYWPDFCSTVLHEYGHLAGMGHSLNPHSIMNLDVDDDRRCAHRGRPYLELHGVLKPR